MKVTVHDHVIVGAQAVPACGDGADLMHRGGSASRRGHGSPLFPSRNDGHLVGENR